MKIKILFLFLALFLIKPVYAIPPFPNPPASSTVSGTVELATDAETVTGTSDSVVTTPGNITARLAAPGEIGGITPNTVNNKISFVSHAATEAANAADMYGKAHQITGAYTVTLPSAVVGMHAIFRATTAAAFSLDCNGSDHFEMYDGTVMSAGEKQTSGGTKNEWIYVVCEAANTWITYGVNGAFTNGG